MIKGDYEVYAAPADLVEEVREIVGRHFSRSLGDHLSLSDEAFRAEVAVGQELVNGIGFARRFVASRFEVLSRALASDSIAHQSNVYLRAARPKSGIQEAIGLHRESFYGPQEVRHCWNIWVPIQGVTDQNGLTFIPGSTTIPTEAMELESISERDSGVTRFSDGHKIGLLYSPKRIVSGIDRTAARVMQVGPLEFALFSGELIHGNATNSGSEIRYSLDFRVIAAGNVTANKAHFSSGGDYFVPYEPGPRPSA